MCVYIVCIIAFSSRHKKHQDSVSTLSSSPKSQAVFSDEAEIAENLQTLYDQEGFRLTVDANTVVPRVISGRSFADGQLSTQFPPDEELVSDEVKL